MKFSLRYLLLEFTLIALFFAIGFGWKPIWMMGDNIYLHAAEMLVVSSLLIVLFCAAIGGLFLQPGRGAIVGLILAAVFAPMAVLGSMF